MEGGARQQPWRPPALRPMQEADLPAVTRLERDSQLFPWPAWTFRRGLRAGWSCWVLEVEGTVCAYGVLNLEEDKAHIMNLCVAASHRRRGLGSRLLAHLLVLARRRRAVLARLEVSVVNQSAIRLYRRFGFREQYVRRGYYPPHHAHGDALVMTRRLLGVAPTSQGGG